MKISSIFVRQVSGKNVEKIDFIILCNHFRFLSKQGPLILLLIILATLAGLFEVLMIVLVVPLLHLKNTAILPGGFNNLVVFLNEISFIQRMYVIAIGLVIVSILKNICIYAGGLMNLRLQLAVISHFHQKAMDVLMRAGLSFFQRQRVSDFSLTIDSYIDTIAGQVGLVGAGLIQLGMAIALFFMLVHVSWKLTLISLVGVLCIVFLLNQLHRNILQTSRELHVSRGWFNHLLKDIIQGMKTIRSFDQQQNMQLKFQDSSGSFASNRMKLFNLSQMVSPLSECLGIILLAGILIVGVYLMPQDSSQDLGGLFAFLIILLRLIAPIRVLNYTRATIIEKWPIIQSTIALLKIEDKQILPEGSKECPSITKSIRCEGIWFRYQPNQDWILSDVSLNIKCGSRVALVGPSGAGKSTLTDLIMRFYDPSQGKILIDDSPLTEFMSGSWRKQVGIVSQDIFLFNDTVMNNFLLGNPKAIRQEVMDAARAAFAHEFISQLPQGYDTLIGERGVLLSGGQRQRLAIARALLAKTRVIIFDEATSSLDAASEQEVLQTINTLDSSVTMISIAHRLATVKNADWIYVLDKGRVIDEGTHIELLQRGGLYKKLVELQRLTEEVNSGKPTNPPFEA